MPGRFTTHRPTRIEPQAAAANKRALSAAEGLRLHWPEYLMEAAESGLYLFSACEQPLFYGTPLRQSSSTWRATPFAGC
jgi:hypothetical protein